MKRKALSAILLLWAGQTYACPSCINVGEFGVDVASNLGSSLEKTSSTIMDATKGFTDTNNALRDTAEEIVDAIMAASSEISSNIVLSSEVQARTLEALKNKIEAVAQTRLIADHNLKVAETYGPENVHSAECISFKFYRGVQLIESLMDENRERQLNERRQELRSDFLDHGVFSATTLGDTTYTPGDAKMAMEQASLVTGEKAFPISPDILLEISTREPGQSGDAAVQLLSAWLRTSTASTDMAAQIAKRARPMKPEQGNNDKTPVSVMEELWEVTEKGLSEGGIFEDSNASEVKLLRAISRRGALNNKIRLEQLETALAISRASAAQIGFMADAAMSELRDEVMSTQSRIQTRRGTGDDYD